MLRKSVLSNCVSWLILPVRKRPSRAQRSLLRVSLLSGGGSFERPDLKAAASISDATLSEVAKLADLESREVLLAKMAGALHATIGESGAYPDGVRYQVVFESTVDGSSDTSRGKSRAKK